MEKVVKSVKIDPELWHRAKVRALSEKMTVQQLIVKLLTEYLGEGKKKGGKWHGKEKNQGSGSF